VPQNRWEDEYDAGHTSRSSSFLRVEVNQVRVFQFDLKTSGGVARMVHVTTSRKLRRDQVKDGQVDAIDCIGRCYPCFTVFYVLDPMSIFVL
jgi:hypothetical protein